MYLLNNIPGRTCLVDNREYLFFSGYAYFGMGHVKEFTDLIKEGVDKYGILFPSSRISNARFTLFDEFENALNILTGMEDTVSFSSGFLAGRTIADIISSYKNIFNSPFTHPAINPHPERELTNLNFNKWTEHIIAHINASADKDFVIVSDSINIIKSEIQDFSFLADIADSKKLVVLIDDSHGIGMLGEGGKGVVSVLPKKENIEYIISYSLSKAYNIQGGAVSCSKYRADELRKHPTYTGSTSINPAMMYAFLNGTALYDIQREKLLENVCYFKNKSELSFIKMNTHDLPIFICSQQNAEEYFTKKKIIISSFPYPFTDSPKIERIVINSLHTFNDIDQLCSGV